MALTIGVYCVFCVRKDNYRSADSFSRNVQEQNENYTQMRIRSSQVNAKRLKLFMTGNRRSVSIHLEI
jgi:hypothetical protein